MPRKGLGYTRVIWPMPHLLIRDLRHPNLFPSSLRFFLVLHLSFLNKYYPAYLPRRQDLHRSTYERQGRRIRMQGSDERRLLDMQRAV